MEGQEALTASEIQRRYESLLSLAKHEGWNMPWEKKDKRCPDTADLFDPAPPVTPEESGDVSG